MNKKYEQIQEALEVLKQTAERLQGMLPNDRSEIYYQRLHYHMSKMNGQLDGLLVWIEDGVSKENF